VLVPPADDLRPRVVLLDLAERRVVTLLAPLTGDNPRGGGGIGSGVSGLVSFAVVDHGWAILKNPVSSVERLFNQLTQWPTASSISSNRRLDSHLMIWNPVGNLLALVLSLLQHVRHSYHPHTAVVLHDAHDHWRLEAVEPGRMIEPGLVMFWFGSDLFYANASLFTEKVRRLVDESPSPVRWLVVDASAITDIDYSAGRAVLELQQERAKAGVVLGLARINRQAHGNFDRLGLAAAIGENHIFASRRQCIEAYQAAYRDR